MNEGELSSVFLGVSILLSLLIAFFGHVVNFIEISKINNLEEEAIKRIMKDYTLVEKQQKPEVSHRDNGDFYE